MDFIRFVLHQFTQFKLLFSMFLLSILLEVAYATASPLSLKYLVDEAFGPKDFHIFVIILVVLIVGGLLNIGASMFGDYSIGKLSGTAILSLRGKLFKHLQKQSLAFYQRYKVGDLVPRFSSDMGSIQSAISNSFPFFLKEVLSVVLGLSVLFTIEWKLTLAVIAGSTLMFVGPRLLQGRAETNNVDYKESQENFTNIIDETIKGNQTIKSFHQQESVLLRAVKQINELFTFGLKLHVTNSLMERLPLVALLILNGTMIGFGGFLIFSDQMTIGDFIAFLTLFMSVGQAGSNLTILIPNLIDANVSFRRVSEILDTKPSVPEISNPIELPLSVSSIRMEQVTFGYSNQSNQLHNVSLNIIAGNHVAFVGPSGSGKSTALQLLSRFYDPVQGKITFDGHDLRNISEASFRRLCLLVTQDTFLFNATIRENLLLDANVSEEEMIEAAKKANIHEVISNWTDGYETMIHREGGSLSGGERQRIAIARALLREPKVLLFDEVTSALDPATEADINKLIQRIRKQKTIITVTHRLASVVHADQIFVFKDGKVIESGTHKDLIMQTGLYYDLWEKQHGFQLSEDGLHATVEVDRLGKIPFFAGIKPELLNNIAALFSTETCKEDEEIVREGEIGHKFYIIVRGKFEIIKEFKGEGKKQVAVIQDGDHFGEIALLKNIPRTATVRALIPSVVLSIRQESFRQLTLEYPQVLRYLENRLKERM